MLRAGLGEVREVVVGGASEKNDSLRGGRTHERATFPSLLLEITEKIKACEREKWTIQKRATAERKVVEEFERGSIRDGS